MSLDKAAYFSFIDLQDKLHQNLCRKRSLVAIGTHDLDTLQPPFLFTCDAPEQIAFQALNETASASAAALMDQYSEPGHALRPYLSIIKDKPRWPVIRDANGVVLSMPPIINGHHSRISTGTKNIFIESTATDLTKAIVVLDTIVTLFSEYCSEKFSIEPVEVVQVDGSVIAYPKLESRTESVSIADLNSSVGVELKGQEIASLLTRMCLESKVAGNGSSIEVNIPPTRHDILHACDIAEDLAVGYGFNNLIERMPSAPTVSSQNPLNTLTELLRGELAGAGYTECLSFALLSREEQATKLRHDEKELDDTAVHIGNPKTVEFQVKKVLIWVLFIFGSKHDHIA